MSATDPDETARVIFTERNLNHQLLAEYEVERSWLHEKVVQETVRETRYDPETGEVLVSNQAVEPERARQIIERCDFRGILARAD